jgi:hypothetical protein
MKNKIPILLLFIANISTNFAQTTIPVENLYGLRTNGNLPDGTFSIKDINNVLLRFTGTWKGEYDSKKYEIRIERFTQPFFGADEDILVMRYKITTSTGTIIEETLSVLNNEDVSISGNYLQNRMYIFTYQGSDWECGQSGDLWIGTGYDKNPNKMGLFLSPEQVLLDINACPNGRAPMPFPKQMMWLFRQ